MLITVEGIRGGRWVVDEREDAAIARRGRPFRGWAEGDEMRAFAEAVRLLADQRAWREATEAPRD